MCTLKIHSIQKTQKHCNSLCMSAYTKLNPARIHNKPHIYVYFLEKSSQTSPTKYKTRENSKVRIPKQVIIIK